MFAFDNIYHKNPNYNLLIFVLSLGLLFFFIFGGVSTSSKEGFIGSKFIRNRKKNLKGFFSKLQKINDKMYKFSDVKYKKMIRRLD
jgi:hypothetical protein